LSLSTKNNCKIIINNCAPYDVSIAHNDNDTLGIMDLDRDKLIPGEDSVISSEKLNKNLPKRKLTKEEIMQKSHVDWQSQFKQRYLDILFKRQNPISANKFNLGITKNFKHENHLKDDKPDYRKQLHNNCTEQSLEKWFKLGVAFDDRLFLLIQ
jgi:hypothetical protein